MRRQLLVLLFCLTAWTAFAHAAPPADDPIRAANASAESAGAPPSQVDLRWAAGRCASASAAQSLWTSSGVHADLAAAPCGDAFVESALDARGGRSVRILSAHLFRIPLLI